MTKANWLLVTLFLALLFSAVGCKNVDLRPSQSLNESTPTSNTTAIVSPASSTVVVPEPKLPQPSSPSLAPQPATFVVGADTVATGTVAQGSTPAGQTGSVYSYWVFNVEEYVIKPLPEKTVTIRILESTGIMPVKGPRLKTGEHLLLFLQKNGDYFELVGGVGQPAKYTVQDDKIQYSFYGGSPWEPLDAAKLRIKAAADTWAGESLTPERREQVVGIALDAPSVQEFLVGKQYEVANVAPYLTDFVPEEIRYLVAVMTPNARSWEAELVAIVNVTKKRVDTLNFYMGNTELSKADENEASKIAFAEPAVTKLLENRGYETTYISKNFWSEKSDGKTTFHIFPRVEILLYPRGSENMEIFVDLAQKKVVKIFVDSHLSQSPLESSVKYRDFVLTVQIPKAEYRVGETAEATMTLSYNGDGPVQLSSPGGQYFDILIKDQANNLMYRWRDEKYGMVTPPPGGPIPPPILPSPSPLLPPVTQNISPGWSYTGHLQFRVTKGGTLYLMGLTLHSPDGYQVSVQYPDGHGEGVNNNAPFIIILAR